MDKMNSGDSLHVDLERNGYSIELENVSDIFVTMYLKRYKAGIKDHGHINLTYNDLNELIDSLTYMRDYLEEHGDLD